jgi:DcaP outer membrane protein
MNTRSRLAYRLGTSAAVLLLAAGPSAAQAPAAAPTDATAAQAPAAVPAEATAAQGGAPAPTAQGDGGAAQGPSGATEQQPEPQPEAPTGFRVGAFTFKPGGRVKLDVIRDLKPIGSEDSFDPRTIPLDGSDGSNSTIHAKETRLNLDIRGTVEERELRMFIETDFYGTSSALRLRHAYGSWGGLLAGQTWSTFVDEDNMPRTIDFESPTAFASIRQAQARWTQKLATSVTWSAAVEDNKSAIVLPDGIAGKAEYPMPDLVTKLRFDRPQGHVATALFLGAARCRPADGDSADSVTLWGSMVSAKYIPFGQDSAYAVFTFGQGIGRYRGGTTAVPDDTGKLHAVGGTALMGGYEHFWQERWSTNATFSVADTQDEAFYTSAVNKRLTYGAVNLLYWFLGDRAWTGVEYLYGNREAFGTGGADGETGAAHRVQYAVRFNLP